jgi:hypothetical protein
MLGLMFAGVLAAGPAEGAPAKPTIRKYGDTWEFYVGDQLVTKYHVGERYPKPIMWPVHAPGDIAVTRDWPMKRAEPGVTTDHVHQKSCWFAYGDVIPEGLTLTVKVPNVRGVDFWAEGNNRGKIVCTSSGELSTKPDRVGLTSRNSWKTVDGRGILDEVRDIELIPLDHAYLFIWKIRLRPTTYPLTFGDTKEGAFGVRVSDRLTMKKENPKSKITNALGAEGADACWGQKADWCDYSGEIDGKAVGITIFDDPINRYRACWHVRATGLMAANPFGRQESGYPAQKGSPEPLVRLKPGEDLTLRYGLLLHSGDVKTGNVADHYRKFLAILQSN